MHLSLIHYFSFVAYLIPKIDTDSIRRGINADLSADARVLTISHGIAISIFALASPVVVSDEGKKQTSMVGISEDKEFTDFGVFPVPLAVELTTEDCKFNPHELLKAHVVTTTSVATALSATSPPPSSSSDSEYRTQNKLSATITIKKVFSYPLIPSTLPPIPIRKSSMPKPPEPQQQQSSDTFQPNNPTPLPATYDYSSIGIAVFFDDIPEFLMISFSPQLVPKIEIVAAAPDPKSKGKSGKDEPVVPPSPAVVYKIKPVATLSQQLSKAVSSIFVDQGIIHPTSCRNYDCIVLDIQVIHVCW